MLGGASARFGPILGRAIMMRQTYTSHPDDAMVHFLKLRLAAHPVPVGVPRHKVHLHEASHFTPIVKSERHDR